MKTKVLVIDDDGAIREAMKKILLHEGYEVCLAADGCAALEEFDPQEFDLLLLDLDLPLRSGWDVFEEFIGRRPSLPVIVITGHSDHYQVAQAAGVGAFMEKPIDALALLQTMKDVLAEPAEQRLKRRICRGDAPRHIHASARTSFEQFWVPCTPTYSRHSPVPIRHATVGRYKPDPCEKDETWQHE